MDAKRTSAIIEDMHPGRVAMLEVMLECEGAVDQEVRIKTIANELVRLPGFIGIDQRKFNRAAMQSIPVVSPSYDFIHSANLDVSASNSEQKFLPGL
jgi:hypothetical protein